MAGTNESQSGPDRKAAPYELAYAAAAAAGLEPKAPREWAPFVFKCPVEDGHGRSCDCTDGDDGRATFYCQNGCAHDAIRDALGLTWRDVAPPTWEPGGSTPAKVPESRGDGVATVRRDLLELPPSLYDAMHDKRPALDPVPGTVGAWQRGQAHVMFSDRGAGKSMAALLLGISAAASGERVLTLDRENGDLVTRDRVQAIFAARPEWAGVVDSRHLEGRYWPTVDASWKGEDVAGALAGFTVVVFDSTREFVGQVGGNPNDDDAITTLYNLLVTPLIARGVCVVLLDNTGHENAHRPKGSGSKLDAAPTAYKVRTVDRFAPDTTGALTMECTRSRHGAEGLVWTITLGGGVYELPSDAVRPEPEPSTEPATEADADADADALALALARDALTDSRLSLNKLTAALRAAGVHRRKTELHALIKSWPENPASGIVACEQGGFALALDRFHGPGSAAHHPSLGRGGQESGTEQRRNHFGEPPAPAPANEPAPNLMDTLNASLERVRNDAPADRTGGHDMTPPASYEVPDAGDEGDEERERYP